VAWTSAVNWVAPATADNSWAKVPETGAI
jgi:hypothetical protein